MKTAAYVPLGGAKKARAIDDGQEPARSNGARGNGDGSPNIGEGQKGASPAAGDEEGAMDASLHREIITRLSKLSAVEYEHERITAAEKLGVRASVLDKLVTAVRAAEPGHGRPLELPEPEPWPSPVNGAALVSELTSVIRKYVVLTENDGLVAALWILHSYALMRSPALLGWRSRHRKSAVVRPRCLT